VKVVLCVRILPLLRSPPFPYTTLFRSSFNIAQVKGDKAKMLDSVKRAYEIGGQDHPEAKFHLGSTYASMDPPQKEQAKQMLDSLDRKSTRLNSSHVKISYAVFCLKKKK